MLIAILIGLTSYKKGNGFLIAGYITGIADSTQIMLQNISSGEYLDSTLVIKSNFTFRGRLNETPEELRIISGLKELQKGNLFYTDLLMGNETVAVKGDISDMPLNVTTSGSPVQKEAELYHKQLHAWNVKLRRLKANLKLFPDSINTIEKKQAAASVKKVSDSLEVWQTSFIKNNFNSYIALVMYNYRRDFNTDTLKKLYNNLPGALKQSKFGKSIYMQVNYPKPALGDNYNDFEAVNTKGNSFKLSNIKDKYILLQFAGTGCYWSHMSMPEMRMLSSEYKDSVSFVSYFMDDKAEWLNTCKTDSVTWLSVWSKGGKYSDAASKYSVTGTPTFVLISPDKKVVSSWFGYEDGIVEKEIRKALSIN
ncbi:TlpA disulfide reductase family protein [Agriterribacter sp.]|uniref:TlpA disulfide reductase family protein n=1 Tax=Agriterribacter sp. TaxID=2821509 RepID=UPI002C7F7322|nr:TlpA disulfide reductase family protein [Agriterribacter sp.]HRP55127.1 TlpA disulfide reductase family protein [Agriterribacter sp.]